MNNDDGDWWKTSISLIFLSLACIGLQSAWKEVKYFLHKNDPKIERIERIEKLKEDD